MWAFESFPAKIEYTPDGDERPTYQVEIFGYLQVEGGTVTGPTLICFRENVSWFFNEIGVIHFLPVDGFQKKFSKFQLVKEAE